MRFYILLTCSIFVIAVSTAPIQNVQGISEVIQTSIEVASTYRSLVSELLKLLVTLEVQDSYSIAVNKSLVNIQNQVSSVVTTLTTIQSDVDPIIAATPSGTNFIRAPVDKVQEVIKNIKTLRDIYRSTSNEINLLKTLSLNEKEKLLNELSADHVDFLLKNVIDPLSNWIEKLNKFAADMLTLATFLETGESVEGIVTFDVAATIAKINDMFTN